MPFECLDEFPRIGIRLTPPQSQDVSPSNASATIDGLGDLRHSLNASEITRQRRVCHLVIKNGFVSGLAIRHPALPLCSPSQYALGPPFAEEPGQAR